MALIPKDQYTGQINGYRTATPKEQRALGRTTYAQGVRRKNTPQEGNVIIATTWEYSPKGKNNWEPAFFKRKCSINIQNMLYNILLEEKIKVSRDYQYIYCEGNQFKFDNKGTQKRTLQKRDVFPKELNNKEFYVINGILHEPYSPDSTWNFQSVQKAGEYIEKHMLKKGAKPNNKKGTPYFISENGYWKQIEVQNANGKKEKTWKWFQYANADWDNGWTLYAQWIMSYGKYDYRITFEQIKEVERKRSDYHDQPASQWTHQGTRTISNGKYRSTMSVRTYKAEDKMDTSEQQRAARRRERMLINKEERELQKLPLTKEELQQENRQHMEERLTKGEKTSLRWLRKIQKKQPTWLVYAENARSLADYCTKRLKNEDWKISQADEFCEKNAKYT